MVSGISLCRSSLAQKPTTSGLFKRVSFRKTTPSIRLHLKHGFRVVGAREKMGKMTFGSRAEKWRDMLLLERRSKIVGVD